MFMPQKSIGFAEIEAKLKSAYASFVSRIKNLENDLTVKDELKKLREDASA
jgi:hypothetical protein